MYNKGIPTNIIKISANWWCKLNDIVLWKGKLSASFPIGSGILQGSLLGGKFFNLMINFVLQLLHKCGLGCHVGNVFADALPYADDLILLSPLPVCMQIMLNVYSETLTNMGLQFNIDKCVAVAFGKFIGKSSCKNLVLYDNVLL